jgi:ABC-2 type transport system permease protein
MTAWELKQIFKNKKFTYSFIIQFFVILAIVPLFDTYTMVLEEPQEVILPTSTSYIPVAISSSPLEENIQEQSIFHIYPVTEAEGQHLLSDHVVCCFISGTSILFDEYNPKARVAEFHLQRLLTQDTDINLTWSLNEKPVVPRQQALARQIALREIRRTAEIMQSEEINFSTLLVLLMAIFLASGILEDLILSEKEKKTGEILLSMPIAHWKVLMSKVLAVVAVLVVQIFLWITILFFLDRVSNLLSMLPLFLTSFLILSLTCLVSVYAKSYKEAGFAITIIYVLLFAFLMSATALYVFSDHLSFLSPLSFVIMIEKGQYTVTTLLLSALPLIIISVLLFAASVRLYQRDEFYFGPRPSLITTISLLFRHSSLVWIVVVAGCACSGVMV